MREEIIGDCRLILGDCREVLPTLSGIHACVTDPPYHLTTGKSGAKGFMGKTWDGGDIAFRPETWEAVGRALLPGAHLLAFSGTRTYHRMACAIEDADFDIRDCLNWVYGSGFPKSLDVSAAIDKAAGAEREIIAQQKRSNSPSGMTAGDRRFTATERESTQIIRNITAPATEAAKQWEGFGTALKPASEPICFARRPLAEKTVAGNVLAHGTGAINIDACRIETDEDQPETSGRWPANVLLDGSESVISAFPNPEQARFFYSAKVSKAERGDSNHPTMKPQSLMSWLCKLVTLPGGIVLDPFAGSGSTGLAALQNGFRFVGIEQSPEYFDIARRRIEAAHKQCRRIEEATKQADMFIDRPAPLKQASMFEAA